MAAVNYVIWLLLFENNFRSHHYTGASNWKKNTVAVITHDRVIDDNLKRHMKNRTLYTCRLFLLTQYDRYYLQNCKAIPFKKIGKHAKYKELNVPSHLHIFWLNFEQANHSFLHPFLLLGEVDFQKKLPGGMSNFPLPRPWWQELGGEFWVGRGMSKNSLNQCIF